MIASYSAAPRGSEYLRTESFPNQDKMLIQSSLSALTLVSIRDVHLSRFSNLSEGFEEILDNLDAIQTEC